MIGFCKVLRSNNRHTLLLHSPKYHNCLSLSSWKPVNYTSLPNLVPVARPSGGLRFPQTQSSLLMLCNSAAFAFCFPMHSAFVPLSQPFVQRRPAGRAHTTARRPPTSRQSPPEPPRNRRVRIPRKYTSKSSSWEWKGRKSVSWRDFFKMDESVIKVIEALWSKSVKVSESPILARFTALGARVLKKVTEAIERTLYPDTEKELVVEYGLTEPNPDDKTYVHPLNDWETSNVTYYCDSFGQRVYLQLDGSSGILAATDYRDFYDEGEVAGEDCEEGEDGRGHTILGTKDSSVSEDDSSRPERIPGVPDTKDWSHDTNPL